MSTCQCKLASGPNEGKRCKNPAKFPANNPKYCGKHKNCKNVSVESMSKIAYKQTTKQDQTVPLLPPDYTPLASQKDD